MHSHRSHFDLKLFFQDNAQKEPENTWHHPLRRKSPVKVAGLVTIHRGCLANTRDARSNSERDQRKIQRTAPRGWRQPHAFQL